MQRVARTFRRPLGGRQGSRACAAASQTSPSLTSSPLPAKLDPGKNAVPCRIRGKSQSSIRHVPTTVAVQGIEVGLGRGAGNGGGGVSGEGAGGCKGRHVGGVTTSLTKFAALSMTT